MDVGVVETYVVRTALAAVVTLLLFLPRDVPLSSAPRLFIRSLLVTTSFVLVILGVQQGSPVVVQTLVATTPLFVAGGGELPDPDPPATARARRGRCSWWRVSPSCWRPRRHSRLVPIPAGRLRWARPDRRAAHGGTRSPRGGFHGTRALLPPDLPGHGGRVRPAAMPDRAPELADEIRASGFRNMTGFRRGTDVWYYAEAEPDRATVFAMHGPKAANAALEPRLRDHHRRDRRRLRAAAALVRGGVPHRRRRQRAHEARVPDARRRPRPHPRLRAAPRRAVAGHHRGHRGCRATATTPASDAATTSSTTASTIPDMETVFARMGQTEVNGRWGKAFEGIITTITDAGRQAHHRGRDLPPGLTASGCRRA